MSPGGEGLDECEKFLIVNIVIHFSRKELVREKGTWVHNSIIGNLGKNTSTSKVRSIALNDCGVGEIEMS